MKYLKTYKIIESENFLNQMFSECNIFIKDLKKCEKGNFLFRGINEINLNITQSKSNTDNKRIPTDTPKMIHDILNDIFRKKFGWNVRNGIFAFGQKIHILKKHHIKNEIYIDNGYIESNYGLETYILFPSNSYNIVWSNTINDLIDILDEEDLLIKNLDSNIIKEKLIIIANKYKSNDLQSAILSHCEISINCEKYYLINQKFANILIEKIWG
jgi:S-adenosylmethionine:tRNA-ribosyltransferase-isomerase (queuine synthetase)